jgi:hypothetical protein
MKTKDNPVIERIRSTRRKIAQRCGYDVRKLGEYYMELQKQHKRRVVHKAK